MRGKFSMSTTRFNGFPKETVQFLGDLSINNNKPWFDAHKVVYQNYVLEPARECVLALGDRLQEISPNVDADPRVNKSIFRIYRDIRFSKDKTPYKTNLALWFPVGEGVEKFDKPGYYMSLEPGSLMLGVGIHRFSKPLLKKFRDAVIDPSLGVKLAKVSAQLGKKGYKLGEKTYKRTPRGYDPEHPMAEFLLFGGLTTGIETEIPKALYTPEYIDYCFGVFSDLVPVIHWIEEIKG